MRKIRRILAVIFAFTAFASQGAEAQALYGADGEGGNPATNLYVLNPATGAIVSTVGPIGFPVTGLAFHPGTGMLYGTTGAAAGTPSLVLINTTTGAGTLIGPNGTGPVADITFRADGTLFGWAQGVFDLVTVNLATGAATVVGDAGISTNGSGIAFSPAGTLYFTGSNSDGALRTINPATGAPTTVVTLNGGPTPGPVNALAFNSAGVLYGSVRGSGFPAFTAGFLVTINTTTGLVTNLGTSVPRLDAIAFRPEPPAPVPTLSQWALIALGVLILGSFLLLRRRA